MELLDRVKRVEAHVAGEVEQSKSSSERELRAFKESCIRKSEETFSKTLEGCENSLGKAKVEAEKEASLVLKGAERDVERVQSLAGRNSRKAVDFILKKIGG